jgi:pimeloyl-ACP methyl ester carboxylesterase
MKPRNLAIGLLGAAGAAVAVKMLTRASTVDWEDVKHIIPHADHSRFMNLDGIRIHYQEFGDEHDPPVILLHGYTASVYVWKTSAPLIAAKGFRVIAIDLVGFGYSEKPRWFEYSIQSQARMVSRFMNRLGIGKASIVGSSYGGAIGAILALDYSERVAKLVLVDAVINDDLKSHPVLRLASVRGVGELITPFLADSKRLMRHRMRGTIHPSNHHLVDEDRVLSIRRPLFASDGHHSLLATSRAWDATRIEQDAHLITQPTLIIWGEEDTVIPIRDAYKLQSEILHSQLVVFKDCGHVPQEERSELFTEKVTAFCAR